MKRLIAIVALTSALVATMALPAQARRCHTLHAIYDNGIEHTITVCGSTSGSFWGLGR